MNSHLTIESNGKPLRILKDQSLEVNLSSPLFNNTEAFTLPLQLPISGNRGLIKTVDDPNSGHRLIDIENNQIRIIADGLPLFAGNVNTEDGSEINDTFDFNVDSRKGSFKDMIADLKCSDIPLIDNIQIGEMIGEVKVDATITVTREMTIMPAHGTSGQGQQQTETKTYNLSGEFTPQALGFSYPARCEVDNRQYATKKEERNYDGGVNKVIVPNVEESYINITDAYPTKKYCNARVCYKHYASGGDSNHTESKNDAKTTEQLVDPKSSTGQYEDIWPYWVLDANRPQSGICFYVLYFLDCLFAHLGIAWDNTELLNIEDMKRLAFFTTHCHFRTERLHGTEQNPYYHDTFEPPIHEGSKTSKDDGDDGTDHLPNINGWLNSRGCGGKLNVNMEYRLTSGSFGGASGTFGGNASNSSDSDENYQNNIERNTKMKAQEHYEVYANILSMYATQDNFPKESVTTLIESLENMFGIRFIYNQETNSCKAVLLRDILRKSNSPKKILGDVLSCCPVNEKTTGVRVCYSEESKKLEQEEFVREGKRDYDTRFDYIDFSEKRVKLGEDVTYSDIFKSVSPSDENCYVDLTTGNAFRIKVNEDATAFGELKPVIFQVSHLHGIEIGDCSEKNEGYVKEFSIGLKPIDTTDVNYRQELNSPTPAAVNAVYIDEDMEHEFITQKICNTFAIKPTGFGMGRINIECSLVEILNTIESYDPTKTEDGNSPLQHIDWGLSVGIMRGGGADATIQEYDEGYDGFGNSKWSTVAGKYQMDIDSMDIFGNQYDYNGTDPSLGGGERFSLKICAYKQFLYYIDENEKIHTTDDMSLEGMPVEDGSSYTWLVPCNADIDSVTEKIRSRGLYHTFLYEFVRLLLYGKRLRYNVRMTVAELISIKENWLSWWIIDGKIGLIDTAKCTINAEQGIGVVTVDLLTPI